MENDPWMSSFLPTMLGALVGIPTGVLIQLGVNWCIQKSVDARVRRSLLAELEYNRGICLVVLSNLDALKGELAKHNYPAVDPYFPLERAMHFQLNGVAQSGRLYDFFSEHVADVQNYSVMMSAVTAQHIQDGIKQRRDALIAMPTPQAAQELAGFMDWAARRFGEVRDQIDRLITKVLK